MKKNSLKSNLIYNTIYQITVLILPFLTAPYVSRVIGANGLGIYSYSHSVALYFVYFAMLGITNYGNREIAKNSDDKSKLNKVFSSIYFLQLITSTIVIFAYLIYMIFIAKENINVNLIVCLHVISAFFDVSWLFFGLQEFKITSIRQMIIKILSFILIILFVKNKNDLWIYVLIMSLSYFLSAFSLWIMMFKKIKFIRCTLDDIKQHLKPCLLLFIPIIATSVYRVMDKIMIGNFSNMSEVGYYENAEKIIMISLGILNAFTAVMMPKIANLVSNKKNEEAMNLLDKSMEMAMFICFALSFGIAAISNDFIPFFLGSEFNKSILICSLLCISIPFITWSSIIRILYLIPYEEDKIYVKSVIIGAIVNFVLNLVFIPKFASLGAVIGTICAEFSLAIYQTLKIKNKIDVKKYLKNVFHFGFFGIVMFFTINVINIFDLKINILLKLLLEIFVGAIVYISFSFFYFCKNNKNILSFFINKRGK